MPLVVWDHREQPDWNALQEALVALGSPVCLTMIATHDDQYALLVSNGPVSHDVAEALYHRHLAGEEEG